MARNAKFHITVQDLELLQFRLHLLPDKVATKIFRAAGRKASKVFLDGARRLTPRSKKKPRKYASKPHMQDVLTSKQKTYGRGARSRTVFIIGPESKQAPHAHLVEKGTGPRYTQRRTQYQTNVTKLQTPTGRLIFKRKKKSVGSFRKRNATGPEMYRGVMPAFAPLSRSFSINNDIAMGILRNEIAKGIDREAKKR